MEINGRFWGSLPLAIAAGVPFAAGLVETAGRGEPPPPFVRNYPEITCCYWIPATKYVLRVLFQASAIRDPLYELESKEERIVGNECVSTCRSSWSPDY